MNTIIVLFGLAVLIAVIYKLINHKDKTPDPLERQKQRLRQSWTKYYELPKLLRKHRRQELVVAAAAQRVIVWVCIS